MTVVHHQLFSEEEYKPGDLVFAHNDNAVGWAIRAAEWLRFKRGDSFNHVAVLSHRTVGGDWVVIEAESHGVVFGKLSALKKHGSYEVEHVDNVNPNLMMAFLYAQLGKQYGFITLVSILLTLLIPGQWLNLMRPNTWICSSVAAEAMRYGGWYQSWPDIYQVSPAQLYEVVTSV